MPRHDPAESFQSGQHRDSPGRVRTHLAGLPAQGATMQRFLRATMAAIVLAVVGASAQAATMSFTGTLADDNDVKLFTFTLAADADVTLRTWSYAGGTNAAGNLVAAGGFDTLVSIFFGLGDAAILFGANDDGIGVAVDPVSRNAFDALLELSLIAGSYTVALSQFDNFANGPTLGDGFFGYGGAPVFDGRSDAWALDILSVDSAPTIPEPTTLALVALGLAVASGLRRSRLPA
jgi:PEP-CTERM motif